MHNSCKWSVLNKKETETCLQWFAGTARIETAEENGVKVGTRSDVILTKHVSTVDVKFAAFLGMLID